MLVVAWMQKTREACGVVGRRTRRGAKKSSAAKQISAQQDDEEEGYMHRKSPALSVWYLPMTDRLRAIFENPDDAKLMS